MLFRSAKELRRAGLPQHAGNANINSSNSNKVAANTFLVANSDQIVFEADLDDNGSVERVEYRLKGETLERSVVTKNADGSVPQARYEIVAQRVDNGGLPVFTFDGDLSGDKPVAADPQQVRVMLLLRSPVRDRKSGRARTVGFEATAERRTVPAVETVSNEPATIESVPAAQPDSDVAASAPASEPAAEPTAKLLLPIPAGLSLQPATDVRPFRFPAHLDLPPMFPAGVVIASTAVDSTATEQL